MKEEERKIKEYTIRFEDGYVITFTPKEIEDLEYAMKLKRIVRDLHWATE